MSFDPHHPPQCAETLIYARGLHHSAPAPEPRPIPFEAFNVGDCGSLRRRFRKFFCTIPTQAKIGDFCCYISGIYWNPKIWSGRRDSNPRPQPWQGCALPLSYARSWRPGECVPLGGWRRTSSGFQSRQGLNCRKMKNFSKKEKIPRFPGVLAV